MFGSEGLSGQNLFYEQRGPLVFSASLHLALLVLAVIWVLIPDRREPEEFTFELVAPSSPSAPATQDSKLEPISYESEDVPLPTLDDIVLPERAPLVIEAREPAPLDRPALPQENPAPATPPTISWEEFASQNPDADRPKNIETRPRSPRAAQIDLSQIRRSLSEFTITSLPPATLESYSAADQEALSGFLSRFKSALKRAVRNHPLGPRPLAAIVACDISAGGIVSNARILRSSGDPDFDRKILEGYEALRSYQAPPNATPLIGLQIEFVQGS